MSIRNNRKITFYRATVCLLQSYSQRIYAIVSIFLFSCCEPIILGSKTTLIENLDIAIFLRHSFIQKTWKGRKSIIVLFALVKLGEFQNCIIIFYSLKLQYHIQIHDSIDVSRIWCRHSRHGWELSWWERHANGKCMVFSGVWWGTVTFAWVEPHLMGEMKVSFQHFPVTLQLSFQQQSPCPYYSSRSPSILHRTQVLLLRT